MRKPASAMAVDMKERMTVHTPFRWWRHRINRRPYSTKVTTSTLLPSASWMKAA